MIKNYRCCISCRRLSLKTDFLRVVRVFPSETITLDQGFGRSAYLCPQASCLQSAQKKNRLARCLKIAVPESIYAALWQQIGQVE